MLVSSSYSAAISSNTIIHIIKKFKKRKLKTSKRAIPVWNRNKYMNVNGVYGQYVNRNGVYSSSYIG